MTTRQVVRCPSGCGSRNFSAVRRGALVQDFAVDRDRLVEGNSMAEGGGRLTIRCECGHTWTSRSRNDQVADLAMYVEGR